jgi:transcriptional regulator with XRE-family HTH domain
VREERQISAEALAQQAALTVSAHARIEAAVSAPGWSTVERIAQALGVSVDVLGRLKEAQDRK